jgi:hypothetical protein
MVDERRHKLVIREQHIVQRTLQYEDRELQSLKHDEEPSAIQDATSHLPHSRYMITLLSSTTCLSINWTRLHQFTKIMYQKFS